MKGNKRKAARSAAAVFLAACLLLASVPAQVFSAQQNTLRIGTAEELAAFSRKCVTDTYSKGLTVLLTADIDLSKAKVTPIAVFSGTFDGQGHQISGFAVARKGSDQGLFRYIRKGGVVKNLVLSAAVKPDGTKKHVGGLAGKNEGAILSCTVSGAVSGDSDVGGIAGINEESGIIRDCQTSGVVAGNRRTGGIAGDNKGLIAGCQSSCEVNTTADDAEDTGGIAGRSSGIIESCVNEGPVGYRHAGYNTGGIAGFFSGRISDCENRGQILGRKDVGGIAGQFEPDIAAVYGDDPVDQLSGQLSGLSGLLRQFSGQVDDTADGAADSVKVIDEAMDEIRKTVKNGGSDGGAALSDDLEQIYDAADAIREALDAITDRAESFTDDADDAISELTKQMDRLRRAVSDAYDAVDSGSSSVQKSLNRHIAAIEDDMETARGALSDLSKGLAQLQKFVREAVRIAADPAMSDVEKLAAIRNAFAAMDIPDLSGPLENLSGALSGVKDEISALRREIDRALDRSSSDLSDALSDADRAAAKLTDAVDDLQGALKSFSKSVTARLKTISAEAEKVGDIMEAHFGKEALSRIDENLSLINGEIERVADDARLRSKDLRRTTDSIIDQLDLVRETLIDIGKGAKHTVNDVSEQTGAKTDRGFIGGCRNTGGISADTNVGGIAGMISPELSLDPEEDLEWDEDGNLLADVTMYVRATLTDCRNDGNVTAKNEYAGGIAGRGDVGAILSCISRCEINTDGNYAGGIAGMSRKVIRRCFALCDLTGEDWIGGIAGEGKDLLGCYAMTRIDSGGECLGAVAGSADGDVQGNFFLEEELAGIDGINYEGQAMPLAFAAFSKAEGIPADFLKFSVTFVADGEILSVAPVEYGGSVAPSQIPEIPARKGSYGAWPEFDTADIRRCIVAEAQYDPWVTTISTGGKKPALLAEGAFSPDAILTLSDWQPGDMETPAGYTVTAGYTFEIRDGGELAEEEAVLHLLCAEKSKIAVVKDGGLVIAESRRDGSYEVFTAENGASFVVLASGSGLYLAVAGGGAALALALILLLAARKRKGRTAGDDGRTSL